MPSPKSPTADAERVGGGATHPPRPAPRTRDLRDGDVTDSDLVQLRKVSKVYAKRGSEQVTALAEVDLSIREGEIVALLGPSGCGKSTLLKIAGGLYEATGGSVTIRGEAVEGPSPHVGMMFQTPALLPWMTVLENALLPVRVRRGSRAAARPKALGHIEMVGLGGFADRYPKELSGGMQQRAGICRMLMSDPDVLLMDEPFGALDELTREYLDVEIRSIARREGKSAVLVTHSVQEAVFVADRVVVMSPRPGRIVGDVIVDLPPERGKDLLDSEQLVLYARKARALLELGSESEGEAG
jgi:NitT/TauT family transport system ATP-binding protein